jgi:hypothetical protein
LKKTFVKEFVSAVQLMTDVPALRWKFVIVKEIGGDAHTFGIKEKISAAQITIRSANGCGRVGISMAWFYRSGFNSPQVSKPRQWSPAKFPQSAHAICLFVCLISLARVLFSPSLMGYRGDLWCVPPCRRG